jgi:hypothetical protein
MLMRLEEHMPESWNYLLTPLQAGKSWRQFAQESEHNCECSSKALGLDSAGFAH